jgi:redox-sensing transcriptional repressor
MKYAKIPAATITRLSMYSRVLERIAEEDVKIISSERLATLCEVNSAQIRKDLSYFGEFGVRGVGYYVKELLFEIKRILGLNREWRMGIVGVGNLGLALLSHENFVKQGYVFVAAFDNDPQKISKKLPNGLVIHHINDLPWVAKNTGVEVGVIATPAIWAQDIANRLIKSNIRAILNFAPTQIHVPDGFQVENVDFTVKLDNLAYHLSPKS